MFRAIICTEKPLTLHIPDMNDCNELFKHVYELQKIYAPEIPFFMIYPVITRPTVEDEAIIEQTVLVDNITKLRRELYLETHIDYITWLWLCDEWTLEALLDDLNTQRSARLN